MNEQLLYSQVPNPLVLFNLLRYTKSVFPTISIPVVIIAEILMSGNQKSTYGTEGLMNRVERMLKVKNFDISFQNKLKGL